MFFINKISNLTNIVVYNDAIYKNPITFAGFGLKKYLPLQKFPMLTERMEAKINSSLLIETPLKNF